MDVCCLQCPFGIVFYYEKPFIEIHSCSHPQSSGVLALIDKNTDRSTIELFKYKWISEYCPLEDLSDVK